MLALLVYTLYFRSNIVFQDDYDGYKEVKDALRGSVLLTTAEHEYTRYGFRELISRKCVDILQPDITWIGGLFSYSH